MEGREKLSPDGREGLSPDDREKLSLDGREGLSLDGRVAGGSLGARVGCYTGSLEQGTPTRQAYGVSDGAADPGNLPFNEPADSEQQPWPLNR